MNTIKIGDYNTLTMTRLAERPNPHAFGGKETFGIFLDGGAEGEILMPAKYVPEGVREGDKVTCFIYLDQDERLIATTEQPLAKVGDFAYLKCTWVNEYGAFLDWGLMKNVFCPFHEQKRHMEIGEHYIVYIYVDEESYRIAASAKVDKFMTPASTEDFPSVSQPNKDGNSRGWSRDGLFRFWCGRRPTWASRSSSTTNIAVWSTKTRSSNPYTRATA